MKRKAMRSTVCLAVAATVAAVATTTSGVGTAQARSEGGYCAILPDSIGLYAGNKVTQMGYPIGTIESIQPQDTGVRVVFSMDTDRSIPADVEAVTRSKSVLADRSLELVGNYREGPRLRASECIPLERAHTPQSISQITGSAADLIDQLAPEGDTRSLEGSIEEMSGSLVGTGPRAANLMRTAASAAQSPERTIADIGSIITMTAPLTKDALARWGDISSIITKLPEATDVAARVLWPGTVNMIYGMQPVLLLISDIEPRYGEYLYPTLDVLADAIHVAATRVGDIKKALGAIPTLAENVALVAERGRGAGLRIRPPEVRVRAAVGKVWCARVNAVKPGSCTTEGADTRMVRVGVLDLLVAGVRG
ncbi:MlaD family protein [Gordonia sp. HS-NH1]|uniref:MlaD family protein n=1 Tax=Gordonia sp. HS-NH1 TaxID=1435068 RepID=UPI0006E31D40|nr:MlaD family protein [Gordonia sp. HS-NH1]